MASGKRRIGLQIHLPDGTTHRALALPEVTMAQLVDEILAEFGGDIRYLDRHEPQRYGLWSPGDIRPLPGDRAIHQLGTQTMLVFREQLPATPRGAMPLEQPVYLRYRSHVFCVAWQPGVIGRPKPDSPLNHLLAVNLEPYSLAVSRRQAEIVVVQGAPAVRRLSVNPMRLNGQLLPFNEDAPEHSPAIPLSADDQLSLESSSIVLHCLLPTAPANGPTPTPAAPEVA
jgi:hypothetical protein